MRPVTSIQAISVICLLCGTPAISFAQHVPLPTPPSKLPLSLAVPTYSNSKQAVFVQAPADGPDLPTAPEASLGAPVFKLPNSAGAKLPAPSRAPPRPVTVPQQPKPIPAPAPPQEPVVQKQKEEKLPLPKAIVDPDEFQLTPPSPEQLFRAESEETSRERIRKAAAARNYKADFPAEVTLPPTVTDVAKSEEPMQATRVIGALCYHPLYFEQTLMERNGLFIPLAQPILSAGQFYFDSLVLPVRMVAHRPWQWQCAIISTCQ